MAFYYKDGFSYGTWINGIYCTGKTVDEVNEELLSATEYQDITITDMDGKIEIIPVSKIGYKVDYKSQLLLYMQQQNAFLWIDNLFGEKNHTIKPLVSYDEKLLLTEIESLSCVEEGKKIVIPDIKIELTKEGYTLIDTLHNIPDEERIINAIKQAVDADETEIVLDSGFYREEIMTPDMENTMKLWEKIQNYQDCGIIYDMGDVQIPLDASVVSHWILTDENGDILFDENGELQTKETAIDDFIVNLAEEYDTYGKTHHFLSTKGDEITIDGGTYGNQINQKAEQKYLKKAFEEKVKEVHVPSYTKEAYVHGKNDIGTTYIEIDMTQQMMYYYQDGEKMLETPVVTGNTGRKMGTKAQVSYIYGKQKNRTLVGPNYRSFVNYWLPINGNVGIHDATWRDEFGGDIYKTNGSHGCINTPFEVMEELYDMVEIGTPVVLFY